MAVEIIEIKERARYEINGKLIYKDQLGNWQWHYELLQVEKEAFRRFAALRFKDPNISKKF